MIIKDDTTFEDIMEEIHAAREAADANVGPEHTQYKMGGHFVRFHPAGILIYGEILDPIQEEKDAGADEEEVEWQRQMRAQPHMKYSFFTKCYSTAPGCMNGEYGDTHVSTMNVPLTKEEFDRAHGLAWPQTPRALFEDVLRLPKMREVPST